MKAKKIDDTLTIGVFSSSSPIRQPFLCGTTEGGNFFAPRASALWTECSMENRISIVPAASRHVPMNLTNCYIAVIYKY